MGANSYHLEITKGNLALFREWADARDMGRVGWLVLGLVVLVLLTSVRMHHWPGGMLGETWSVEFVPPWR